MKKNISINLQGMIFHIEEDGYEQLSQYLTAIKTYFSAYEGHEEITADIEARMAEIFFAKLSPTKQVITCEDVQALIAKMGSVKDFQNLEETEDKTEQTHEQRHNTNYASGATDPYSNPYTGQADQNHNYSKRIFRDEKRKIIGGVAAGIANYMNTDPLWARLAFVLLTFLFAIPGGFPAGFIVIVYALCWAAFPKSYTLPETTTRKLFRNAFDKKLGGVASGIAIFFGMDVAVIRLIFLVSALLGGFGLLTYFVLWVIVPEANSITDRVQMAGNPITLSGIEETLKNNLRMQDENGAESKLARIILLPMRLLAQLVQFLARIANPIVNFLVTLIRIFAGTLLLLISGILIFALFVLAATALGIINGSDILSFGPMPFAMFARSFPEFGLISGFVSVLIPLLFILFLSFSLFFKHYYLRSTVGWPMFGIWVLSLFLLSLAVVDFMNDLKEEGEFTVEKTFSVASYQTVILKNRNNKHHWGKISFEMETYAGSDVKLVQTFKANGLTESEAIKNADMISYRSSQADSVLTLDANFKYKTDAIYRNQELHLKLLLPENKKFRISENLAGRLHSSFDQFIFGKDLSAYIWEAKNNKLVCLNCPSPDSASGTNSDKAIMDENAASNFTSESILLDAEEYGDNSRSYNFSNFESVKVSGALHIRIQAGKQFSVLARGNDDIIRKIEIEQDGAILAIKQENKRFNFKYDNSEPVLLTITMPQITNLDLSGAVKAEVMGFDADDFNLDASGAVESLLAIKCRNLNIDENGACKTILVGSGEDLTIDASGASQVEAHRYKVKRAKVDLSGVCKARVNVEQQLNASVAGPSQLTYRGDVEEIKKDESGMGRIERE